MNNIFEENTVNVIVFELQVILVIMKGTEKSESSYYSLIAIGIDTQVTHHVVAMEKVVEEHILTKCSKYNTFQVIGDLVHDFMNFNALKIILKIHKK